MALVEPLVGHLLSQYAQTVTEGLEKIRRNAENDTEFAVHYISHPQGVQALKSCLQKSEHTANVIETLCTLVICSERPITPHAPHTAAGTTSAPTTITRGQQRGAKLSLIREFCSGEPFAVLKKALSALSDATLPNAMAVLKFLSLAAASAPKMLLARFNNKLPLHFACFRPQLPYSQRRIRLSRLTFLLRLAESRQHATTAEVLCTHGFLTTMFEDAAEVLQEASGAGLEAGKAALHVFQDNFILSQAISAAQKRTVLMGQRNIFRLLVKALEVGPVAEDVAEVMYHMVTELVESPSDYASNRVEASDGRGMPNFPIFFLLRQLRPNASALASRIVLFILTTIPDLIRPYFARVSGHLADEGNLLQRVAPSTARVATLNLITRVFMAPIPYHLLSRRATLEAVAARANTFYTMSPRDVADEVCPQWVAEYVHKVINGSTNLMTLALAMQLTEAALARAKVVLALVADIQRAQQQRQQQQRASGVIGTTIAAGAVDTLGQLDEDDLALFTAEDAQEDAEDFDARVQAHLLTALPRREEFWHRMTQQLHPILLDLSKKSRRAHDNNNNAKEKEESQLEEEGRKSQAKVEFVYQRMLLLMDTYTDVFGLRVSWLSAAPAFLPSFTTPAQLRSSSSSSPSSGVSVIGTALAMGNDALCRLSAGSVAALSSLLVAALARGVAMPKLHHITMSNAKGSITEWPLLLSLLLWATKHLEEDGAAEAIAWVARVVQWVVHSVTVRHGCSFEEALLWVTHMQAEAIPCFLHMLNSLLQRSLSKAADRVAQELTGEDGKGLLLASSEAFVSKTEEKAAQAASGSDATAGAGQAHHRKKNAAKGGKANDGTPAVELWVEHLQACLPAYKAVMKRVAEAWPRRTELAATGVIAPLHKMQKQSAVGCGRATIFDVNAATHVNTDNSSNTSNNISQQKLKRALHHRLVAKPPAHGQLKRFCETLMDPLAALVDDSCTLSLEESALLSALADTAAAVGSLAESHSVLKDVVGASRLPPAVWCRFSSFCWTLAGRLLTELDSGSLTAASSTSSGTFARALLRSVAEAEAPLAAVLAETKETDSLAFHVLLLVLLRVELVAQSASAASVVDEEHLATSVAQSLERVMLKAYTGTLSTTDRVRYASLLSLHYIQKRAAAAASSSSSPAAQSKKAENEEAGVSSEEDEDNEHARDDNSSKSGSDTSDDEDGENEEEEGKAKTRRAAGTTVSRHCTGATVPSGLVVNRFLIAQHEPATYTTPEADMLAFIVGSLTEKELQAQALSCPARLHNNLRCRPAVSATAATAVMKHSRNALDLLLTVFPEMTCAQDASVLPMNEVNSGAQLDPRYLLPLLHTVGALPGGKYRYLCSRCAPVLVRALSFTEVALRRFAMSALFTVAQVPQQRYSTPEGVSSHANFASRRIVASFARLKMVQLAEKHKRTTKKNQQRHHVGKNFVPRLPGPLSAFLVLALDPIANFSNNLHNHFVRFLDEPKEAFATTVPFASWFSSFPIDAVSSHLMLKQQLDVQRTSSMVTSSIAQSSAEEAINDLRKHMPPHLSFMTQLVQHACGTTGDAVALVQSESIERLMLLCDLVTSSSELRLQFVECLTAVCSASFTVASMLALRKDGRGGGGGVLPWLLSFLGELNSEYDADVQLYSDALYTQSVSLLLLLCRVVVASSRGHSGGGGGAGPVRRHEGQGASQLKMLRAHLQDVRVTAKETLDLMDACVAEWNRLSVSANAAAGAGGAAPLARATTNSITVSAREAKTANGTKKRPREAAAESQGESAAKKEEVVSKKARPQPKSAATRKGKVAV